MIACFKCGTTTKRLYKHHISYFPEKIVDCCWSCHQKIHHKVRKENTCPLSVEEVNRLSKNSSAYRIRQYIEFNEIMMPHVYLREEIMFTKTTGNITVSSFFKANNGMSLFKVNI